MFPYLLFGAFLWLLSKLSKKPNASNDMSKSQSETPHPLKDSEIPARSPIRQDEVTKTTDRTVGRQEKAKQTESHTERWTVIFTALIFVVTGIYAVVSFFQWRTMEKSLRISERAYMVVSNVQADFEAAKVTVLFENIGRIPAEEFKLDLRIERDMDGNTLEWRGYYFAAFDDQIFPGPLKQTAAVPLHNFTPADADLLKAGKQKLYVSCYVEYQDGFGNLKETSFVFRYVPPPNEGWQSMHLYNQDDIQERNKRQEQEQRTPTNAASPSP